MCVEVVKLKLDLNSAVLCKTCMKTDTEVINTALGNVRHNRGRGITRTPLFLHLLSGCPQGAPCSCRSPEGCCDHHLPTHLSCIS